MPESLWPTIQKGNYSVQDVIRRPLCSISTGSFTHDGPTPTHSQPYHDQLLYVIDGSIIVQTANDIPARLEKNSVVIITANHPYRLSSLTPQTRAIAVCLGAHAADIPAFMFDECKQTPLSRQKMQGWMDQGILYLKAPGIKISLKLFPSIYQPFAIKEESIRVNDLTYIHPNVRTYKIPTLK
jgi:quercetin dioxygenase-like cupin family protein